MQLFNTLTRKVEPLQPIKDKEVSIYTCGPTVYDYPHIGNWFTFIRWDLLVRTLQASGYTPKWVMNITDVGHLVSDADEGEDKLIKGALREGKTAWEIAEYYSKYFIESTKRLNFTQPWQLPRATDHIKEQIDFITQLENKGYTYTISDGVYFDTSKFPKYNQFAVLDLDEQQAGARVKFNPEKRNSSDFSLWKFSPKDKQRDMEWNSPWGKGFPGWHIECSAMCLKYLGETIDIHCGGIEHIPVHHTNEIAQSQALTNKPLANIWLHGNHILIDDQKISKSLGNGLVLEDIEKQGFNLEVFRLLVIESHYRSQSHFSWDSLAASSNRLLRYRNFAALRYQSTNAKSDVKLDLLSAMQDDLNTPKALLTLEGYLAKAEKDPLNADSIINALKQIDSLLGLSLMSVPDINEESKALIQEREQARQEKDWLKSDQIRQHLVKNNIGINDAPNGSVWHYLS